LIVRRTAGCRLMRGLLSDGVVIMRELFSDSAMVLTVPETIKEVVVEAEAGN
jgi:hypothetical protein